MYLDLGLGQMASDDDPRGGINSQEVLGNCPWLQQTTS